MGARSKLDRGWCGVAPSGAAAVESGDGDPPTLEHRTQISMQPASASREKTAAHVALGAILLTALVQSVWNTLRVPALNGYDEPGHVGYILTLVREGRLPHPLEGWSTFHPPVYYVAASLVWRLAEPLGAYPLLVSLRSLSVVATLLSGAVAFLLVRRQRADVATATVATLLVLFIPCRQIATTMLGNEAMVASLVALALFFLADLQRDPGRFGNALAAGIFTGLAIGTKYTALALLPACVLPFVRAGLDGRGRRAAAACGLVIAVIAGPVYARNLALTGELIPMARDLDPMRSTEQQFVIRPRQVSDYLWVPWGAFRNPTMVSESYKGIGILLNSDMLSVWGLVHAGVWYDPFEVRVPERLRSDGSWIGTVLTTLGVIPTLMALAGFLVATARMVSKRLRDEEAPITLFAWCALGLFVGFTWKAPALVAVKASYLLPLGVPAAIFFGRGMALLGPWTRRIVLAACFAAVLASAVAFTEGVLFDSRTADERTVVFWKRASGFFPGSHIDEAFTTLGIGVVPRRAP